MTIGQTFAVRAPRFGLMVAGALLALTSLACTGDISGGGMQPPPPGGTDVGRIVIHRLSNFEYKNTVRDLIGVEANTQGFSNQDGKGEGFDTIASEFGVTEEQYVQYFNAAVDISDKAFADPTATAKVLTCTPSSATDAGCFKTILQNWGLRAWRRPLKDNEITDLTKVGTDAMGMGEDGKGAIKQIVKAMLASPHFLYRIEYDPDPASKVAHALSPYELSSRLSYLMWSTMPDDKLFELSASEAILTDATIEAQIERMLGDTQRLTLVSRFAAQWLGMEGLMTHAVSPTAYPMFDDMLKQSMYQEGLLYFQEFLFGDRKMTDFFTSNVNFVNAKLAKLYGVPGVTSTQLTRVTDMAANRQGFMGLGTFLTNTSFDYRTSPTLRGKWVLENLLCQEIPKPPDTVPKLDGDTPAAQMMGQSENVRERLEKHRSMPDCAACHAILDPIGLGLENFDGIGQYRTKYPNGDDVNASGVYDMKNYNGLASLATMLSDPKDKYLAQLTECSTKKMLTYALSRSLTDADEPYVKQMTAVWKGGGMKDLLKKVVLNPTFRFRHGEP